jgi:hypothetical protein
MRRIALILAMTLCVGAPALMAQDDDADYDHGTIGVFAEYFRLENANTNLYGLGGRAGFNVHNNVQLEGEVSYDFRRSGQTAGVITAVPTTIESDFRALHAMFGPKFHTGNGWFRAFATVKGGVVNFGRNDDSIPAGFVSSVKAIDDGDTNGVLYPAAGIEMYGGWFGVRAEFGDEIYFDEGANHNFRFTIGPSIRF